MGSEITESHFSRGDFHTFAARLKAETDLYKEWWKSGRLAEDPPVIGFELESWLVDKAGRPTPLNAEVLAATQDPLLAPELAQYNLEFNGLPRPLAGASLSAMQAELEQRWRRVGRVAAGYDARLAMVGILPTLRDTDLPLSRMSRLKRYQALNEQVLVLRNRRPLRLDIEGDEHLAVTHGDVMLESVTTSLQLHLQVTAKDAPRLYNAAVLASAATVAVAANSPFLFGRHLWQETRIPAFEQAVAVEPLRGGDAGPLARVGFGTGYARDALYSFFIENRQHYPVLLPVLEDVPVERLAHMRLHNGTIWRWNRPLIGFNADGRPHLRIEHRVMAAGPSVIDTVANAAFYYGLVFGLADDGRGDAERLPFPVAQRNFYAAARHGLAAELTWFGGERLGLRELVLRELLPRAARGLAGAGVASAEAERYLAIVEARVRSQITGAAWQTAWANRHGRDFQQLVNDYLKHQESGAPVHLWPL